VAFTDLGAFVGEPRASFERSRRGEKHAGGRFAIRGASVVEHQGDKIVRKTIYYEPRQAGG